MRKILTLALSMFAIFAVFSGVLTTSAATTASMTWTGEASIFEVSGNYEARVYTDATGTCNDIPTCNITYPVYTDGTYIGTNGTTGEGDALLQYTLTSTELPTSVQFEVIGATGTTETITVDATSGINLAVSFHKNSWAPNDSELQSSDVFVKSNNALYKIVGATYSYDTVSQLGDFVIPYSANGINYELTFTRDTQGTNDITNVVITDLTQQPITPSAEVDNSANNTKVVNGPGAANSSVILLASALATTGAAALYRRRK